MNRTTSWLVSLVTLLLTAVMFFTGSIAQATVGTVIEALNNPTVETPTTQPLQKGRRVNAGDTIVTGPNARVQLLLDDGTRIAIKQSSRFLIEELEMPADKLGPAIGKGQQLRARFALRQGGFRTMTGRISSRDRSAYRVSTPSAVIGIRGTNYVARICQQDCDAQDKDGLYVGVSEGSITLTNDAGTLVLEKNEFGFAADFQTPPEKLLMPPNPLQNEGLEISEEALVPLVSSDQARADNSSRRIAADDVRTEEPDTQGLLGEEPDTQEIFGREPERQIASLEFISSRTQIEDPLASLQTAAVAGVAGIAPVSLSQVGTGTIETRSTATTPRVDTVPPQAFLATTSSGAPLDLTGGTAPDDIVAPIYLPRGLAYVTNQNTRSLNAADELMTFDAEENLVGFTDNSLEALPAYSLSPGVLNNAGTDQLSDLRWGRWTPGAMELVSGSATSLDANLHWVVAPLNEPTQVATGTANYLLTGNTDPTDDTGQVGILGSASLSADFTNSAVTSSIELSIGDEVWTATGAGSITQNLFAGQYTGVTVNGAADGAGAFNGMFSNYRSGIPLGAGLVYQLTNSARTVTGAVVMTQ